MATLTTSKATTGTISRETQGGGELDTFIGFVITEADVTSSYLGADVESATAEDFPRAEFFGRTRYAAQRVLADDLTNATVGEPEVLDPQLLRKVWSYQGGSLLTAPVDPLLIERVITFAKAVFLRTGNSPAICTDDEGGLSLEIRLTREKELILDVERDGTIGATVEESGRYREADAKTLDELLALIT